MRVVLQNLVKNWATFPSFAAESIAKSAYQCFGPVGLDAELDQIKKSLKVTAAKSRRRTIASENPEQSYEDWRARHDALDAMKTTLEHTKSIVQMASFALHGKAEVPSKLLDGAIYFTRVASAGAKTVATQYSHELIKQGFDLPALEKARSQGKTQSERFSALQTEMRRQAAGMADFSKFSDDDAIKALDAGLGSAMKYESYLSERADQNSANIDQLKNAYKDLNENVNRKAESANKKIDVLGRSLSAVSDEVGGQGRDNANFMNFMIGLNEDTLSPRQKLYAIQKFGYGDFKDDQAKADEIKHLQLIIPVFDAKAEVDKYASNVGQVGQILSNLGIHSEFVNSAVTGANKVAAGFNAVASFVSGNYLGAVTQLTGLFGGGGDSANAQIISMLSQVLELQKKTIELQVKTMHMIEDLSLQVSDGFRQLDVEIKKVMALEWMNWSHNYFDFSRELELCHSVETDVKKQFIAQTLGRTGQYFGVASEYVGEKRLFDQMASRSGPLPSTDVETLIQVVNGSAQLNVDLMRCIGKLKEHIDSLINTSQLRFLPSEYTYVGRTTAHVKRNDVSAAFSSLSGEEQGVDRFLTAIGVRYELPPDKNKDEDEIDRVRLKDDLIKSALAPRAKYSDLLTSHLKLASINIRSLGIDPERFRKQLFDSRENVLDPVTISEIIRMYLELSPLATYVKFAKNPATSQEISYSDRVRKIRDLVIFMIAQQNIITGEAVLPELSEKFVLVDDSAAEGSAIAQTYAQPGVVASEAAYRWVTNSPYALRNVLRFRLARAFYDRPKMLYSIAYQYLKNGTREDAELLNGALAQEKIEAMKDGEGKMWLQFKSRKNESFTPSQLAIELPSPEDFFNDKVLPSPEIQALHEIRDRLDKELYYSERHEFGPVYSAAYIDELVSTVRRMAL